MSTIQRHFASFGTFDRDGHLDKMRAAIAEGETVRRRSIKVTFANGETITTEINGSVAEIRAYYIGTAFNIGSMEEDNMQEATNVEFIN